MNAAMRQESICYGPSPISDKRVHHGENKFGIKVRALLAVSQGRFNLQCLQETQAMFARPLALSA